MAEDDKNKAEELTQAADENVSAGEEVDKDAKKGKKSKAAKSDAPQVQITWRSKEKEKPLVLDKHKVILWVLVGFAVLGLVLGIIPFVVTLGNDDGGGSDAPWSVYVSRLSAAGYTVQIITPGDENLAMCDADLAIVLGQDPENLSVHTQWAVNGSKSEEDIVTIMALDSETAAAQIVALSPAVSANVGKILFMGTEAAMTTALGREFVVGNANPFLEADFGHDYINSIRDYVFNVCPVPVLKFYYDNSINNNMEDVGDAIITQNQQILLDLLTNYGDEGYTSPGNADMIFKLSGQASLTGSDTALSVIVLRYAQASNATLAKNNLENVSETGLMGVEVKGSIVVIVASNNLSQTSSQIAATIAAYLP